MTYPLEVQKNRIFGSTFRTDRKDLVFKKESTDENFKKLVKSIGRGKIIQKLKNEIYKESCNFFFFFLVFVVKKE